MNESIDIYIDTTSHESSEATEFDFELFKRFVSGGPWVAHSEYMKLKDENAKLREAVATAIKIQAVLCGDADRAYCHKKCLLHRQESNDCLACDVIGVAQELGIEVN